MGQTDQEPNSQRKVPTFLWVVLGLFVVLAFAAAVALHRPGPPPVYSPPAGSPPTH
ncbi:MAG: hypothetical protein JWO72_2494 [Caulobacteraceae bacterium]|nr:hypothetical protein [Caulobacteraceae bacterium]